MSRTCDTIIVGAGLAGLTAAAALRERGRKPLVVDKGRGLGGRLANRRFAGRTFDHGAQFMTTREPRITQAVQGWEERGWVRPWFRSESGHVRWRGEPAMTSIAKALAEGLDIELSWTVASVALIDSIWRLTAEDGREAFGQALILTAPVPQSMTMLDAGNVSLSSTDRSSLEGIEYERCLAVMLAMDEPAAIPGPGGLSPDAGPIAWMADNCAKGISQAPAVTIHATPEFSLEHWDADRDAVSDQLVAAAKPWLRGQVIERQIHGWRYAKPRQTESAPARTLINAPPLLIAGDAFGGPRLEGAMLSGYAAADCLLSSS